QKDLLAAHTTRRRKWTGLHPFGRPHVNIVGRAPEKSRLLEHTQQRVARDRVEVPEATSLSARQPQPGHLLVFRPNDLKPVEGLRWLTRHDGLSSHEAIAILSEQAAYLCAARRARETWRETAGAHADFFAPARRITP